MFLTYDFTQLKTGGTQNLPISFMFCADVGGKPIVSMDTMDFEQNNYLWETHFLGDRYPWRRNCFQSSPTNWPGGDN